MNRVLKITNISAIFTILFMSNILQVNAVEIPKFNYEVNQIDPFGVNSTTLSVAQFKTGDSYKNSRESIFTTTQYSFRTNFPVWHEYIGVGLYGAFYIDEELSTSAGLSSSIVYPLPFLENNLALKIDLTIACSVLFSKKFDKDKFFAYADSVNKNLDASEYLPTEKTPYGGIKTQPSLYTVEDDNIRTRNSSFGAELTAGVGVDFYINEWIGGGISFVMRKTKYYISSRALNSYYADNHAKGNSELTGIDTSSPEYKKKVDIIKKQYSSTDETMRIFNDLISDTSYGFMLSIKTTL